MVNAKDKQLALREAVRWNYSSKQLREVATILTMVVNTNMTDDTFHCLVQAQVIIDSIVDEVDATIRDNKMLDSFKGF